MWQKLSFIIFVISAFSCGYEERRGDSSQVIDLTNLRFSGCTKSYEQCQSNCNSSRASVAMQDIDLCSITAQNLRSIACYCPK